MSALELIQTDNAPAAVGPYSQAVQFSGVIFTAGQIALDPATGQMVGKTAGEQTEQVIKNLAAILEAAGTNLQNVIKTTVFLRRIKDFAMMNEVYARHFAENPPARSTVAVSALPLRALVEIEVVAYVPPPPQKDPIPPWEEELQEKKEKKTKRNNATKAKRAQAKKKKQKKKQAPKKKKR